MNMISTGAFLNEMDASNKQPSVAEKFAAVWEKKNAKAARAGGVSLMALSLAACGSSSTTTTSTSTSTDTSTTTTTPVSSNFTTSIDTLTGGDGADTFKGDSATVSGADSVTGGAGSDTLQVYGVAASALPTMSGIENLEIHNVNPGDVDLTGSAYADVTKLTLDGFTSAGQTVTVEADDTLALVDVTEGSGTNDVNVAAAATIETIALEVNGNVGGSTTLVDLDINATGATAITLATTGKNYVNLDTAGATSAVKLTITGDGTGTVDVDDDQTTIDASAATGGLKIQGDFAGDVTIKGSTGNDTIVGAGELSAKDSIDGGAGEDTLSVTADFTAKTGTISNIEILEMADTSSQTIDTDDAFAGITQFKVSGTHGTADSAATYTLNDAVTGSSLTVTTVDTLSTDTAYDDVVDFNLKTDGTADTLSLTVGSATAASLVGAINVDEIETLTMAVGAKDGSVVESLSATDATSITLSGDGNTTINAIDMKDATSTFDASAATGNLTLTFSDAQTQTIKTGSGKDNVKISDAGISAYDVFDLGDGADKLTITDVGAAVTATLQAANTETLIFETAASGSIDMDLSKATPVRTIVIDDAGSAETFKFDFMQSGTTVQLLDIDDTTADTHTFTGVTGAAAITIEVDAVDAASSANDDTLDVNNFTAVTLAQKSNTLTGTSGASVIADLDTGDATTLTITSADNSLTVADVSTAKLTSITVSGSTDVSLSSGGATTITSIDASGLSGTNNGAELNLGGTAGFARAATATITGSDGADSITMAAAATTHAGNVIDAGSNDTVSASVLGDVLVMYGTMSGDTVIDLSSTTDQVTSLSGVANAAVQKGFESFDGSNAVMASTSKFTITGSSGINHIFGDSGADIITAGAGADIIKGNGGNDIIDAGAGADVITLAGGTDVVTSGADSDDYVVAVNSATTAAHRLLDFASGEDIQVDWSASGSFADLHIGSGAARTDAATTGDVSSAIAYGLGGAFTMAATDNVLLFADTANGLDGIMSALAGGTTTKIIESGGGDTSTGDEFLTVVTNSTTGYVEVGIITCSGALDGTSDTVEHLLTIETSSMAEATVAAAIDFIT